MMKTSDLTTARSAAEHYAALSDNYDSLYTEINNASIKIVEKNMQLQPTDIVVDIGGGSGFFAEELYKTGQLKSPVWCVDPSEGMIEVAKKREGVVTALSTAEDFSAEKNIKFDKVLMVSVVHHFKEPVAVYRGVYEALKPNGFCLITLRQPPTILPFFEAAKESFNESCQEQQDFFNQLKAAGFDSVSSYQDTSELNVSKRRWFEMVRGRFFSSLDPFSDDEIEEGIRELENGHFKEIALDTPITLYDVQLVVKATK